MYSVTWFDIRGMLRYIATPSEDTAEALYMSLAAGWGRYTYRPRMWHHPAKGVVTLLSNAPKPARNLIWSF